jgi:4-oxalocrotonate tautomerase family enzyme
VAERFQSDCYAQVTIAPFFFFIIFAAFFRKKSGYFSPLYFIILASSAINAMPLIKIEIAKGKDKTFLASLINVTMDCIKEALQLPADDKNIRLTEYDKELFQMKPPYRLLIEISMFSGRSNETKKQLYQHVVSVLSEKLKFKKEEIFILINEQPKENWGIRGGLPASEIALGFKVEI